VWDLDNTLWDGVLVENGASGVKLKPGVLDVVRELDRRGILQSIASKNNPDEAAAVLTQLGIAEFFLAPQVSWMPKSAGIDTIARTLNIGLDTILFVDDTPFELEQVRSACPGVRVLDASESLRLADRPDCDVRVTAEAGLRRQMYREEAVRQEAAASFGED